MKTYICTLLLSMAFAFAHAQTEPEFELEPYVFNLADSTLASPLPCESAYSKAKAAASLYLTGIGKVKSYLLHQRRKLATNDRQKEKQHNNQHRGHVAATDAEHHQA